MQDPWENGFGMSLQDVEETKREETEAFNRAVQVRGKLTVLKDDERFLFYLNMLKEQKDTRVKAMLAVPSGLDSVVKGVYLSGEVAGLELALGLVDYLIKAHQGAIDLYFQKYPPKQMTEDEDGDGTEQLNSAP